jgi:hypothetical protein
VSIRCPDISGTAIAVTGKPFNYIREANGAELTTGLA